MPSKKILGMFAGADEIDEAWIKKDIQGLQKDRQDQKEKTDALKEKQEELEETNESFLTNNKKQKKINFNLKNETKELRYQIKSLNIKVKDLEKENNLLKKEIEKFKLKINQNFSERISFNEKKIVEIFKFLKQTKEIFKKIQESTSFYIHKNFELNQNLQERKDSIKSQEIIVMSDHSNQNFLIQTSDDEFYVLERQDGSNKKINHQDLLQKEYDEKSKRYDEISETLGARNEELKNGIVPRIFDEEIEKIRMEIEKNNKKWEIFCENDKLERDKAYDEYEKEFEEIENEEIKDEGIGDDSDYDGLSKDNESENLKVDDEKGGGFEVTNVNDDLIKKEACM